MLSDPAFHICKNCFNLLLGAFANNKGLAVAEFANKAKADGASLKGAVQSACLLRLRPILMTSGAMILGALPLVFASGSGAEARRAIGLVLVGGLFIGTGLTLFILPYMYQWVKGFKRA